MERTDLREKLLASLPPIFTRQTAAKLTGGLLAAGSLANLDSAGKGPAGRIQLGRRVAYERTAFVDWLMDRMVNCEK